MSRQLLVGVVIGAPAAVAGLVFGIPGMAIAIVAIGLIALIPRLPALLAGGLIGLGATWLALFANWALLCTRPDQVCGATPVDMSPWLVFSAAIMLAGIVVGGYALRRATQN